jgi:hypothetical protein
LCSRLALLLAEVAVEAAEDHILLVQPQLEEATTWSGIRSQLELCGRSLVWVLLNVAGGMAAAFWHAGHFVFARVFMRVVGCGRFGSHGRIAGWQCRGQSCSFLPTARRRVREFPMGRMPPPIELAHPAGKALHRQRCLVTCSPGARAAGFCLWVCRHWCSGQSRSSGSSPGRHC